MKPESAPGPTRDLSFAAGAALEGAESVWSPGFSRQRVRTFLCRGIIACQAA